MADLARTGFAQLDRASGSMREVLAFRLADDFYAVGLPNIQEILSPPPLTYVPRAPRDVIGVCSVRGLLVTVVDLRRRLRVEERSRTRQTRVLLTKTASEETVGLYVDEVRQVVRLGEGDVEVAQSVLGGELSDHVVGIARPKDVRLAGPHARDDDNILVLLDLSTILEH